MTELETLQRAALYVKKMANGVNPLTDAVIEESDFINNVRISRCLFYVSDVLEEVIKNGGKVVQKSSKKARIPFYVSSEDVKGFNYSKTPISLSAIADKFNELIDLDSMQKMSYKTLADWLISQDVLTVTDGPDGKPRKMPTDKGLSMGVSVIQRTSQQGIIYDVIVYDLTAQKFIVQNIMSITQIDKYLG